MRLTLKLFLGCVSVCLLTVVSQVSLSQTFSASIAGVVTDPSGSVVPGAKIHLQNLNTNDMRDATSSTVGSYKFDNLLPGTYEISAEAPGFEKFLQKNMILLANTAASIDVHLVVGGTEQTVQVTGEAVLVDTQSANNSTTLDSHLLESLPNSYRNP
jgi:hypothetical protein